MVWAALQHHVCARNGIGQRSGLNFLNSFHFVLAVKKTASVEVHGARSANMRRWYTRIRPKSLTQGCLLQTGSIVLERRRARGMVRPGDGAQPCSGIEPNRAAGSTDLAAGNKCLKN